MSVPPLPPHVPFPLVCADELAHASAAAGADLVVLADPAAPEMQRTAAAARLRRHLWTVDGVAARLRRAGIASGLPDALPAAPPARGCS